MRPRHLPAAGLSALALSASLAIVVPAPALAATTITVNTLSDSTNGTDGKCSLREAILSVSNKTPSGGVAGECVAGTGTDLITFSVSGTILLSKDMDPLLADTAIIDGGNVITIDGRDMWHPMVTGGTVQLRHLIVQNGNGAFGGGISTLAGDLSLSDVIVRSNTGENAGGGIYAETANLNLDHVQVSGNLASGQAGGVMVDRGNLTMTASRIFNNTVVTNGNGALGGGLVLRSVEAGILGSSIDHNDAIGGGGMFVAGTSSVDIIGSTIAGNTASSIGGGLYNAGDGLAHYVIRTSTFSGNSTDGSGGAIYGWWDWMDVRTSTFSGNTAATSGGAVHQVTANDTSFVNTTFANNATSGRGGAVTLDGGGLVLLHTTVTGNTSAAGGGALDASVQFTQMTVGNSIVAGNSNGDLKGDILPATDNVTGSAVGVLDPGGLKDNGGNTKTVAPLKTATSVIDKASDGDGCPNPNVNGIDQRGVTRVTGQCDIGAVELESGKPTASAPKAVPATGSSISSTVPVRITAGWSDPGGSGVKRFVLQKSVNGGSWTTVTSTMPATGTTLRLSTGSSYRFRVKPVDYDGNVGVYTSAATAGTPAIRQQSSATFSGSWTTSSSTSFSGGSAKKSSSAGASAKYTFTGRAIGFVTTKGSNRGKAKIYIDGVLQATIDLYASSTKYKVVAWSTRFSSSSSHTIKVVVVGTPSRPRVDVDAFTVLK